MNKNVDRIIRDSLREFMENKELLNEMAYSPKDYCSQCGVQADIVYLHLGKLFLYGDSTRNAEDWVNQIIDRHIVNMVCAKYTSSLRSKTSMFYKGYIEYNFGKEFTDYKDRMTDFCKIAKAEVRDGCMRLYNKDIKPLVEIDDAVEKGKDVVMALILKAISLLPNNNVEEVRQILKNTLKEELQKHFGIIL